MTDTLTIRFHETQWFDVACDCELVRLMATSSVGTWHATVDYTTTGNLRCDREAFKVTVLGEMQMGLEPKEITIG